MSSIRLENRTTGSYRDSINTNGPNGGCSATIGNGVATCEGLASVIAAGGYATGTATFQATDSYNTLQEINLIYYLATINSKTHQQSMSNCYFRVQIAKQINQSGQPWRGQVTYAGTRDSGTALTPRCSYSNLAVDTSSGQFSVTLTFGGS